MSLLFSHQKSFSSGIISGKLEKNVSRYADYKDWVKIPNEYLNRIKKQFSNFGLTYLSKFNFNYNVRAGYCTRDNIFFHVQSIINQFIQNKILLIRKTVQRRLVQKSYIQHLI